MHVHIVDSGAMLIEGQLLDTSDKQPATFDYFRIGTSLNRAVGYEVHVRSTSTCTCLGK